MNYKTLIVYENSSFMETLRLNISIKYEFLFSDIIW